MNAIASSPGTILQRSVSKAMQAENSAVYDNRDWDLVDAINTKKITLAEVKSGELPEEMKAMTLEDRQAYIEKQTAERKEIQEKINLLNTERKMFVAEEMKKQAESGEKSLDQVMIESLHKQAGKLGYVFGQ